MNQLYQMIAPCHFGLESTLSGELKRLDANNVCASDGKVEFSGDASILARANICLRTAERVLIKLGAFSASSFDQLFEGVRSIPFEQFIGKKDAFPVKGWSLKSALHSIPDCQSIIKKAAVERMKSHYRQDWFAETGPVHQIRFSIMKDQVTITLDSSGVGLHKRGYRIKSGTAPIKETLAAGMVDLGRVKHFSQVADPFCGSGTLLIEAATKALNLPPSLHRKFAAEEFGLFPQTVWQQERSRGMDLIKQDSTFHATGYDTDPDCITLTQQNAKKAGVSERISVSVADMKQFTAQPGLITLTNPPYGERLLEKQQAEALYRTMGRVFETKPDACYYIISPHERFEMLFGRRADRRRKVYNGMIRCQIYQYYKNENKPYKK